MPTRDGGLLKPFGGGDQVKIYNRHESVEPTRQNRSTDSMTTVMLTSINICRAMLDTSEVRNGFIEQAGKYGHHAWFRRGRPNKQVALEKVVDNFIKEMQNDFPRIFLDYAWNNPTSYGCHFRHPYEGSFKGSDQYILLNGKRARHMLDSAIFAQYTKPDSEEMSEYDAFLFMFANTLLHELAHVLTTYLTEGKELTPPDAAPDVPRELAPPDVPLPDKIESAGEAGFSLEDFAFGGVMYYMHDPDRETLENRCGTAYVEKEDGLHRVELDTIRKTVNCSIKFPYKCDFVEPRELTSPSGGKPRDLKTDPRFDPGWRELWNAPPPSYH